MEFKNLVRAFSDYCETEELKITDNVCTAFEIDDIRIVFLHETVRDLVFIIGEIGHCEENQKQSVCELLLKANYQKLGSDIGTMSLNPETDCFEMIVSLPLKDLNADSFITCFENTLQSIKTWRQIISTYSSNTKNSGNKQTGENKIDINDGESLTGMMV